MSLVFELGISSATTVTLNPEYDYAAPSTQLRSETRTRTGKRYEYKWGSYDKFKMSVQFVTASDASLVNSWWDARSELLLFITSDSTTEVHSVMLMNDDKPFSQFQKPYVNLYRGKIELETY